MDEGIYGSVPWSWGMHLAQSRPDLVALAALEHRAQTFSKNISALDEQVPFSSRADVSADGKDSCKMLMGVPLAKFILLAGQRLAPLFVPFVSGAVLN